MDGIELKQADHNAMSPSPVRSLPPSAVLESVTSERLSHPSLKRLCKHIDRRMRLHRMSAAYYRRKNLVFLYPSVILNTAASILSFTGAIYTDAEKPISVTVGVVASLSSLVFALSHAYEFQAKAVAHRDASEAYTRLKDKLFFKSLQDEDVDVLFQQIEERSEDIARRALCVIPAEIEALYARRRHEIHRSSLCRNIRTVALQQKYNSVMAALGRGDEVPASDIDLCV